MHDSYEWAFLQTATPENPTVISVWPTLAHGPDKIYVNHAKFADSLDNLVNELNDEIDGQVKETYKDYDKMFMSHYEVGLCVAAKDFDDRFAFLFA